MIGEGHDRESYVNITKTLPNPPNEEYRDGKKSIENPSKEKRRSKKMAPAHERGTKKLWLLLCCVSLFPLLAVWLTVVP